MMRTQTAQEMQAMWLLVEEIRVGTTWRRLRLNSTPGIPFVHLVMTKTLSLLVRMVANFRQPAGQLRQRLHLARSN